MKKSVFSILLGCVIALSLNHSAMAENSHEPILYCPQEYISICDEMQEKYGVSSSLLIALIQCESSCNPNAISSAGCIGLMQVNPINNVDGLNLYDPRTNIELGTQILLRYKDKTEDGDLYLVISYYNGLGDTAARWYYNEQWDKFTYAKKVCDMAMMIDQERENYEELKKAN